MAASAMTSGPAPDDARAGMWLMPGGAGAAATGLRLLEADPDLGRSLDPAVRTRLAAALRVRVETVGRGIWQPAELAPDRSTLGLLVLDGLLLRDLSVLERCCTELIGPGDLLRPWSEPDGAPILTGDTEWQVVDGPARIAVLDRSASALIGRFPSVVSELLDRALRRGRTLQFQLVLTQVHGIAQRLQLLLWYFADRWGRVTLDGVVLPLALTHEMLGRLIGARRPSVTTALSQLAASGAVERRRGGWLLRGDPRDAGLVPLGLAI